MKPDFEKLRDSLIYVMKENQMKLGYTDNAASLNYPPASLCRLLGCGESELDKALDDFIGTAAPLLGEITVSVYDGQYCLTVPVQGARYVHEQVPESPFLRELIDAVSQHRVHDIEGVTEIFSRYGKAECVAVDGDGYDHVVRFADGEPDDFVYLFETDFGHVSYHRMTAADYQAEMEA